jgi:hypothetical protein
MRLRWVSDTPKAPEAKDYQVSLPFDLGDYLVYHLANVLVSREIRIDDRQPSVSQEATHTLEALVLDVRGVPVADRSTAKRHPS